MSEEAQESSEIPSDVEEPSVSESDLGEGEWGGSFSLDVVYQGVLPTEYIHHLNQMAPGFANDYARWLTEGRKLVEEESSHRRRLETTGLWMGYSLAVISVLGSLVLIYTGHTAGGAIGLVGAVCGMVSIFVAGRILESRSPEADPGEEVDDD